MLMSVPWELINVTQKQPATTLLAPTNATVTTGFRKTVQHVQASIFRSTFIMEDF